MAARVAYTEGERVEWPVSLLHNAIVRGQPLFRITEMLSPQAQVAAGAL